MAAGSNCLLFIVASILLLAIEEGKQGFRLYDMSREFVKLKRMREIVSRSSKYTAL
jgi:hypothetical protein